MKTDFSYDRLLRLFRWGMKWVIRPALVLMVVFLIIHSILLVVWGRQLEKRVKQFHDKGHPVNATEIAPKPVSDDQNGAVMLQKIFDSVESRTDFHVFIDPSRDTTERMTIEQQVRVDITNKQRLFPVVRQAVEKPVCIFPVAWESGAAAMFPHLSPLRQIGRLIAAKAIIDAEDGEMNEALDDVALGIDLVEKTKGEPLLISFLFTIANTSATINSLQLATRTHPLSYEQAERMYQKLSHISLGPDFSRALDGEYTLMNWFFTTMRSDPQTAMALLEQNNFPLESGLIKRGVIRIGLYLWRPLTYKDQMFYLEKWDKQLELESLTFREMNARKLPVVDDIPKWAIITRCVYPHFGKVYAARDRAITSLELGHVAMALKAYKAKYGSYPSSLDELKAKLGWKLPNDLFTGRPFVYHRKGEGFILYSWGPNLKDDGGRTPWDINKTGDLDVGDLVWTSEI